MDIVWPNTDSDVCDEISDEILSQVELPQEELTESGPMDQTEADDILGSGEEVVPEASDPSYTDPDSDQSAADPDSDQPVIVTDNQPPIAATAGPSNSDDLQVFVEKLRNKNTERKIKQSGDRFVKWLREKQGENRELIDIPPNTMDQHIGNFIMNYQNNKTGKVNDIEPDTLSDAHRNINKCLDRAGYGHNLFTSPQFKLSREVLAARRKELKSIGKGNKTNNVYH